MRQQKQIALAALLLPLALAHGSTANAQAKTGAASGTTGGVEYSHTIANCNGNSVVMLRFENRNKMPVTITWQDNVVAKDARNNEAERPTQRTLILKPGVSEANGCDDAEHRDWILDRSEVSPLRPVDIASFTFSNVVVTRR